MFTRHWLSVTQFQWDAVTRPNNWITVVFCVILFVFTMTFITFRRKLLLIFRAMFSQRHFSLLQREGKIIEDRSSICGLLFDLLTISTGLVMFCGTFFPRSVARWPSIVYIVLFLLMLLAAYALKLLCNELYARLFDRDKERTTVNHYKFIFITDFSVVLFPLLILTQYAGWRSVYLLVVVLFAVLFSVWIYRLMKINSINGHRFHFFVYFCTLEILPWVIFLKVLLIV